MESIRLKLIETDDIAELIDLMRNLNIETKGCRDVEQMRDRICEVLVIREHQLDPNKAFQVISDAQAMEKQKTLKLREFYADVEKVISDLDDTLLKLLKASDGNVLEKIKSKMEEIENKKYVVLVAGETSAGKSSMLNLILGEELLPFSALSTTSTICELKYGQKKKIRVHYKQEGRGVEEIYLDESSPYMDQISKFVHAKSASLRETAPQYKKVELFWDHDLLKTGVVIVDSPGIGESDIMDNIVVQYLPNAFAFIYVINSTMAGGVQKDRLQQLLDKTRKLTVDKQVDFSSNCALFVCNKWDGISPSEEAKVMKHIAVKLRQCWPNIDPGCQIIRLSTTKALNVQKYGFMNEEFALLTENIGLLIKKSIETRLEQHWSWLDYLLQRIAWMMTSFLENANTDRKATKQKLESVVKRLRKLQVEQESLKEDLRKQFETKLEGAINELISHLKLPEVVNMFCTWHEDDLPGRKDPWKIIENGLITLMRNRLVDVIKEWEEEKEKFSEARSSMVSYFLRKYNYLEGELRVLEIEVMQDLAEEEEGGSIGNRLIDLSNISLTNKEKFALVPFALPLAAVAVLLAIPVMVLVSPVVGFGAMKEKAIDSLAQWKYKINRAEYAKTLSLQYLQRFYTREELQPLVKDQLDQALSCLRDIERRIPMLIDADVQLCQRLMKEEQSKQDVETQYKPKKEKCECVRGQLGLFGALEIRSMQISWCDLQWNVSEDNFLQQNILPVGTYQGRISSRRYPSRPVNLRVYQDLLTKDNITECLAAEKVRRNLRHQHIVEFLGAVFRNVHRGVEAVFVTERCGQSLKSYLGSNPAVADHSLAIFNVIRWAQQIVNALMVVHGTFQGCVHGDLRLENVLIDSSNLSNIKLSNILLTQRLEVEYESKCDMFLHLAPEALRSKTYDTSSEIYSLGVMLWEMWYGKEAFDELKGHSLKEFLDVVEKGHRPQLELLPDPQIALKWSKIIKECWKEDETKRSTLANCASAVEAIFSELNSA